MSDPLDTHHSNLLDCMVRPKHNHPPINSPLLNFSKGTVSEHLIALNKWIGREAAKNADQFLALPAGKPEKTLSDLAIHHLLAGHVIAQRAGSSGGYAPLQA